MRSRVRFVMLATALALGAVPGTTAGTAVGNPANAAAPPSTGVVLPEPQRDQPVPAARVRDIAVAFVYPAADNLDASLDKMAEAGVRRAQVVASWTGLCPTRDACDWSVLDRYFEKAKRRGISTAVHVNSTPDWVHPDLVATVPDYGQRIWYPPTRNATELQEFSDFVQTLATRYRNQVDSYEIWNEENWRDFYKPVEDPADYAKLLRTGYLAVKAKDRKADVIFGGTTRTDPGFVREVYAALRKYPDAARNDDFFDAMGAHPYTDDRHPDNHDPAKVRENAAGGEFDDNFLGIDRLRSEMVRQGDAHKKIYLGEFSYSSVRTWMGLVPDDQRAYYLRRAYELAAQRPYVSGLAWFVWSEVTPNDEWHGWTLLEYPNKPTRTYQALAQLTGAVKTPDRRPVLRLDAGKATVDKLPAGVQRAELYLDGVQVANGNQLPLSYPAPPNGKTALTQLVLYTKDRTIDTAPIWTANGQQITQVSHSQVKASRSVDVSAGVTAHGPVKLRITAASGQPVSTTTLGIGRGRLQRFDTLVALDKPGTYHLSATDVRGRPLAGGATLEVLP
ncbi:beta-galactosidase [Kribbella solani]|uniref:beta-galactosidase n=1 Tax=Kribbella solani TaxID=236067 RepID=UPI0029BBFC6F|nr:beta-galactosidase [Kribbella solani]MDX2971293.1 beta-galactosidase [Kribbella solani]